MSSNPNWLEELQVGDPVIYQTRNTETVKRVTRLTKTQIVITYKNAMGMVYEIKFSKRWGHEIGKDQWTISNIVEATPERVQAIEAREEKRKVLQGLRPEIVRGLPTKVLRELREVISRYEKQADIEQRE